MRNGANGRPSVSVVITTYNWPGALRVCLDSFRHQTSRDFEILVADDGSGPATREAVAAIAKDFAVPSPMSGTRTRGFDSPRSATAPLRGRPATTSC
jgi:glycosyltransferase involved in cell wall biosynthesis